ncbi:MAG TPA: phospholipid carrier-dependent glycosyltransferase [Nocardioides sp.]|uniref:dolichyl-phosphate-mannose--protein mannosyltransferase n=1 Tax=Nocardioides sp. TaxID=35761 RepID=UPI002C9079A2|nr:phospholipid carrier-dependent glycosyltransferase [Nocardioides sp.]HQR26403.1 phospholipid carrier-dependent glycosyltransferase [Nocardioides sp.]
MSTAATLPESPERSPAGPAYRPDDRFAGWAASLAVTLLALFLRLWQLGTPKAMLFDETYYAKDAWSLVHFGYVRTYVSGADQKILDGHTTGLWTDSPSMIVHPEVGKWLIGLGERALGMDPTGWRVSAAVVGSLMVLVMCRLALRLTGSIALAVLAGLLLTFDGLQLVLSRLALLDIFVAFFLLLGVHCLVLDRFWFRARLRREMPQQSASGAGLGPVRRLLVRPWLLAAGVSFGLAVGTKWAALYPLAAFGLLVWLWSAGARRARGLRRPVLKSALVDGIPAFVQLVVVAALVYVASWTGWLVHADQYEEHLSSTQYTRFVSWDGTCDGETMTGVTSDDDRSWPTAREPDASGVGEVTQSLRSLWYYHQDVLTFHRYFLNCATHDYASAPSGWLLVNRPVGADAQLDIKPGQQGCDAAPGSDCLRQVLIIGTPALWWGSVLALLASVVLWVGRRDWRYGVAVVGVASTWLPWLMYDDRPIFSFYAILALPFLVLACTLVAGELVGRSRTPSPRRTLGVIVAGSFFTLVLVNFAWFWPIWTDGLLTHSEWLDRIWFQRWI